MKTHGESPWLFTGFVLGLLALPATGCITAGLLDQGLRSDELHTASGAFRSAHGGLLIWVEAALGGEWSVQEYTIQVEPGEIEAGASSVCTLPRRSARRGWGAGEVAELEPIPVRKLASRDLGSPGLLASLRPLPGWTDTLYYTDVPESLTGGFPVVYVWDRGPAQQGRASLLFPKDPRSVSIWPFLLVPPALVVDVVLSLGELIVFWGDLTGDDDEEQDSGRVYVDGESVPAEQVKPAKALPGR